MSVTNPTRMGHPASKQTLIEDETEFRGKLVSKCPVVVKGKVDGEIEGPSLNVSVTGSVTGKVKVGELRSEGTIGGEFDAETIHLAGTVKDKTVVKARSLEVKLQPQNGRLQVTFGECELNVGDVTTKEDAVSAAQRKDKAAEKPADKPAEKPAEKPEDSPTNIREAPAEAAEAGEAGGKTRGKTRRDTSSPTPA